MATISIASTTDTQEAVNKAAGIVTEPVEQPEPNEEVIQPESETASESPAAKTEGEQETKGQEQPRKSGWQKRVDKLTKTQYELLEKIARLEEENERVKSSATQALKPATEELALPLKPTPEQFSKDGKTYEDYLEALVDWKDKVRSLQAEQANKQQARAEQEKQMKETFDAYNVRVHEFREAHEDFDQVVGQDDIQIPQSVQLAVVELENGPEVAYYLGKNPEVCEELMEMSPLRAVARIGVIASSLEGGKTPSPAAKTLSSSAPAPIKPVGGAATKSSVRPGDMTLAQYRKWYSSQYGNR